MVCREVVGAEALRCRRRGIGRFAVGLEVLGALLLA